MILLVGASGRLGSVVAELLLAQGKAVRVMTRTPFNLTHLKQQGAEVVHGDLRDPASLLRACQGVEQVVAAAMPWTERAATIPTWLTMQAIVN